MSATFCSGSSEKAARCLDRMFPTLPDQHHEERDGVHHPFPCRSVGWTGAAAATGATAAATCAATEIPEILE